MNVAPAQVEDRARSVVCDIEAKIETLAATRHAVVNRIRRLAAVTVQTEIARARLAGLQREAAALDAQIRVYRETLARPLSHLLKEFRG